MRITDYDQRVEELQLAMSDAFESRKTPAVSVLDEEDSVVINVSWVTESGRDTTLDSRCSASVRFTTAQLERYSSVDIGRRKILQGRVAEGLRQAFARSGSAQPEPGACSLELRADDAWFDPPATAT
ncbi:hypothetical protein QCE63_14820 [Caballeronia sp. LZ065]|uniref:DUF3022 domain-containing protein n=1 Tax=Caballeronia sp. LZ065 TaxID=3038571 RepID=UPI00285CAA04|nr:hypothetical protein [Caballeronia sp. LZ065]MDR5780693.1 hypothetical protein [Caballeronia sp. LZ065]